MRMNKRLCGLWCTLKAKLAEKQNTKKSAKKRSPGRIAANVIGIFLCVVLIPVFLSNLILIIQGFVRPEEVPSLFGISPMIVKSGSMETEIMTGDIVIIKKINASEIKVNDVIAFKDNGYVTTHRVIEIVNNESGLSFRTKGDNNTSADRYAVDDENVIGIYVMRFAKIGKLASFLGEPLGMVVFVGIPFIAIIVYDIIRRNLYAKKAVPVSPAPESVLSENEELKAEIARLKALAEKPSENTPTESGQERKE